MTSPLRASVSRSERWGNSSAYLTGLSLPSHLCGPGKRGGRPAAAAAVSNLLLRIVSAPLWACVSELAARTKRGWTPGPYVGSDSVLDPPRIELPSQAPTPTPRSPGPRRPGDVLIAAASAMHEGAAEAEGEQDGASEQQQPRAHGSGPGRGRRRVPRGPEAATDSLSAPRAASAPGPALASTAPAARLRPRRLDPAPGTRTRQPRLRLRLQLAGPAPAGPRLLRGPAPAATPFPPRVGSIHQSRPRFRLRLQGHAPSHLPWA